MGEYIINPMWFYWVHVASAFRFALLIALCIVITGSVIIIPVVLSESYGEGKKSVERMAKIIVISCLIGVIIFIFLPAKETMYQMMIAKYATHENVSLSVEAIKSAVDYIVEKIGAL